MFGIKAALFPLYFWLPDSYPTAPSAVTAIFAGLLTKVGVYAIIRTQTLLFPADSRPATLILVIAGATMVVGVLGAIAQDDVKRIFSFYIVSQIGYIIMGLGLFTVAGLAGAVYAIVHHIVVKTTLFLVGGLIEHAGGTSRLNRLGDMVATAPVIAVLFLLPALSLAGIPPFSGFAAKFGLFDATARSRGVGGPRRRRARQPADAVLDLQGVDRRVLEPARDDRDGRRSTAPDAGRAPPSAGAAADARADGRARRADAGDRRRRRPAVRLQRPRRRRPRRPGALHRGGARPMRAVGIAVGLAVIWVLLWGSASPANVLGGLAVGVVLVVLVPGLRRRDRRPRFVFRPVAIARLVGHMLRTMVESNVVLTREVLTRAVGDPHRRRRRAAARLLRRAADADHATCVALSPGTMPLELRPRTRSCCTSTSSTCATSRRSAGRSSTSRTSRCGRSGRPRPSPPRTTYLRQRAERAVIAVVYAVLGARRRAVRCSGCCAARRWPTGSSASTG